MLGLRTDYVAFLACVTAGSALAAWWSSRLVSPWRTITRILLVLLLIRLAALENPWAWGAYEVLLKGRHAGSRQMDVIREQRRSFFRQGPTRYLAVGTSQTDALYARLASERSDLRVLSLGGMFPLDLMLHRERIFAFEPRCILLYVSEWDLARRHEPEHIAMAPAQRWRFPGVALTTLRLPGGTAYRRALVDLAIGEVLPEVKYGFVFRLLLKAATGALPRDDAPDAVEALPLDEIDRSATRVQDRFSEDTIPFHEAFLRSFIEDCGARGIRVAIVEGQLIPRARVGKTAVLAERASAILRRLASDYRHVQLVPIGEQPKLADGDFVDLTHVRPEVGLAFSRAIVARLDAEGIAQPGAGASKDSSRPPG